MSIGTTTEPATATRSLQTLRRLVRVRDYGVVIVLVGLFIALTIGNDHFFSKQNFLNMLDQWAPLGIVACAGTLVLIAGGLDLSISSVYALSAVVAAKLAVSVDPIVGLVLGLVGGAAAGTVNGLLTTVGRINALIATLATSIVFAGVALYITNGQIVIEEAAQFTAIGNAYFLGITLTSWVFIGFALLCGFLVTQLPFGRYVFASGGNPEAARLSGVRVGLIQTLCFTLSGAAAGLAGILEASRVGSAQADMGSSMTLQAIAAIVIGGTSILGGQGAIWRTVVGLFTLALINNGINLLHVNQNFQQIVQGGVILLAVGVDAWTRNRRSAA
jgi:ribose transport system permease protein